MVAAVGKGGSNELFLFGSEITAGEGGDGMEWLKVHDWEHWQSYRSDRGQPPWIKVHRQLLRDAKWASLGSHDRGDLVSIWLLAADHEGKVPADPALIRKFCFMDEEPNLKKFIDLGLLEGVVTPTRRQVDANTTPQSSSETEEETEKKKHTRTSAKRPALATRPAEVSEQVWSDFLALRKTKRAPLTETALSGIYREADKAGLSLQCTLEMCCQRGWQGFKAEWYDGDGRKGGANALAL